MSSCCESYVGAKSKIEAIAKIYHPDDFKIFTARREFTDGVPVRQIGLVVKPDDVINEEMTEEFEKFGADSSTECIRFLYSQVDVRDGRLIDLFIFRYEGG